MKPTYEPILKTEMGGDDWMKPLNIQLPYTRSLLEKRVGVFHRDPDTISALQEPIRTIRASLQKNNTIALRINTIIDELRQLNESFSIKPPPQSIDPQQSPWEQVAGSQQAPPPEVPKIRNSAWEQESAAQLIFTQEALKPFNDLPYLLLGLSIFKIYIVPFFAVLIPLIAWVLPYIVIRVFFNMPMPFETYTHLIKSMWLGGKDWTTMDTFGKLRILFQTCWTAFGLFQGIFQPIQQAIHLKHIDEAIMRQGTEYQQFASLVTELSSLYWGKKTSITNYLSQWPVSDARQLYAYIQSNPTDIPWIWSSLAKMELEWRLATCPRLCIVRIYDPSIGTKRHIYCNIRGFCDPSIDGNKTKSRFLATSGATHYLVTGPNKGGKSSVLRSIFLNIWLAQTLGMAYSDSMELAPFDWIRSGLRLVDTPGKVSLFERELSFAAEVLRMSKGRGLVIYDECFHSTNPPDGEMTARIFLSHIWKNPKIVSIVSTHVFPLVDSAPIGVSLWCVPATISEETGKLVYSYILTPGICKISSVREIYEKYGFPSLPLTDAVKSSF